MPFGLDVKDSCIKDQGTFRAVQVFRAGEVQHRTARKCFEGVQKWQSPRLESADGGGNTEGQGAGMLDQVVRALIGSSRRAGGSARDRSGRLVHSHPASKNPMQ